MFYMVSKEICCEGVPVQLSKKYWLYINEPNEYLITLQSLVITLRVGKVEPSDVNRTILTCSSRFYTFCVNFIKYNTILMS